MPTSQTSGENPAEKHTRLARSLPDQADREIAEGDLLQGPEEIVGAVNHALKAVRSKRGWKRAKYAPCSHADK